MEPITVDWSLSRTTKRWARALFMAVALTVAVGVAWLVPSGVAVGLVGVVILMTISLLMLNQAWTASGAVFKVLAVVALLAAIAPIAAAFFAAKWQGMEDSGTRHTVTVTGERRVKPLLQRSSDWYSTLSEGGVPVPGELVSGIDEFDPGDVIEVYSDGLEHIPADEVEQAHLAAVVAGVSHLIALPLMAATGYFAPMRGRAIRRRSH